MESRVIAFIVIAFVIGSTIGYALTYMQVESLKSQLKELEKASKDVTELHKQLEKLKRENESLRKENEELKAKLSFNYVETIKSRGKLIVGTSADWPPFEYIGKDGKFAGIDIEIAKRIAQELGVELEIKDMKFAALIEALKNGQVDIIIADITPTAEREQQIDFSIPYYFSKGYAVLTVKDKNLNSIEDLYGKKIGVQLGTIQQDWAEENLKDKAEIITYNKVYPDMIFVLKRGDVDAIIVGDLIADVLIKKDPELKIAFYAGAATVGGAVGLPEDAEDLKYVVNMVIESLLEKGEMKKIFDSEIDKWLSET